jgi:hypothetical protein
MGEFNSIFEEGDILATTSTDNISNRGHDKEISEEMESLLGLAPFSTYF